MGSPAREEAADREVSTSEAEGLDDSMMEAQAAAEKPPVMLSTKAAMALLAKKKKMMAREAFSKKLQRMGVKPSKALDYKKQQVVLAVGQERNRIIERDEFKKIRSLQLKEGTAKTQLENAPPLPKSEKKPSKAILDTEESEKI